MDSVESMFYFGEVPWHKKGTKLIDIPTSERAIIAAGLDWDVRKEKVYFDDTLNSKSGCYYSIKNVSAIVRNDKTGAESVLGIVGKRYTPVQNKNAFNFFDSIVGEKKAIYHTAGSLEDGKIIWILAKLPDGISISGNDEVELYTLLSNRHDGKRSLIVQPTPVRVVCNNTLNLALVERKQRMTFRHTTNIETQMKMAALSLNHSLETFSKTKEAYKLIASKSVDSVKLNEYFEEVLSIEEFSNKKNAKKNRLVNVFDHDVSTNSLNPSLWIAYNAVTYWSDHEKGNSEKRLSNSWFGSGFAIKQKALDVAIRMAA